MAPRLEPSGPLGGGFGTLLAKRLKRAEAHLGATEADLKTAVHDARKEFKAGRSLIRMVRHLVPDETYRAINAGLRDAGHAIAGLRDTHAVGDAITVLVCESGLAAGAGRSLERAARRAGGPERQTDAASVADALAKARDLVTPLRKIVRRLDLPDDDPAPYVKGLARSYGEARAALEHGFGTRVAEDLHDARKRVINWRYQLDAVSPIWPAVMGAEVGELRALRRHLGQHNDIVMLQHLLETDGTPWARIGAREAWIGRCGEVRARLVARAELAARLLFSERPKRRGERIRRSWRAVRRMGRA